MLPINTLSSFIQNQTAEGMSIGFDRSTKQLSITNNAELTGNFRNELKELIQDTELFFSRKECKTILSRLHVHKFNSTVGTDDCYKLLIDALPESLTVKECKLISIRICQTQNISDLKDTVEEISNSKLSPETKSSRIGRLGISQRLARVLNSVEKKEVTQCLVMTKCLGLRYSELEALKDLPLDKK